MKCLYRRKVQMNVDTIAEDDLLSLYSTKLHGSRDRRFTFYIYTHLLSTKQSTENARKAAGGWRMTANTIQYIFKYLNPQVRS